MKNFGIVFLTLNNLKGMLQTLPPVVSSYVRKEKQSGNEANKKDNCQVNPYGKSETNKSADKNKSEQMEKTSKQAEMRATNTESSSYLNNSQLMSTTYGKYSSKKLVTDQ